MWDVYLVIILNILSWIPKLLFGFLFLFFPALLARLLAEKDYKNADKLKYPYFALYWASGAYKPSLAVWALYIIQVLWLFLAFPLFVS